ncbi:MAG: 16S rRNA pseudouridine(516) synthase [Xanthomonadaceae bacterium]|nr:16S rRNA pseudouridine(516) synthase [Xanthomonadaceae bacterium]MDP2185439.1 16S rRNA pseudouridine(516) synthase [Xanthomonadales bacterium]MDZ4116213.1 16S rRNA pseudouridine(516) synthase [Xanthomonadaceae bacterium]MDZ4377007.1 16S rRNA pseudouridine(516) synthase [Xanthomonadaceae bacterium]
MKLVKLLANLGYGSRKEVTQMLRNGWVMRRDGSTLGTDDSAEPADIVVDDEPLDPPPGMVLMLHKPIGVTCSTRDAGGVVYDLLPPRFRQRNPVLSTVGRLDRDTSGLLLMTDDGALLHRIISPKAKLVKVYEATLAEDLRGDEAAIFASGTLLLESETTPVAPAQLAVLGPRHARLSMIEGRYHQVRRMFAAQGNHVLTLQRISVGGLGMDELAPGQWRLLNDDDLTRIFA